MTGDVVNERKLTNKDLIRVRKRAQLRGLAISEEHERSHTGTAVNRRLRGTEGFPEMPLPTPSPEERTQMILHVLMMAGMENLPIGVACSRIAAKYGLSHNQVPALKDEVLHYLDSTAKQVKLEIDT